MITNTNTFNTAIPGIPLMRFKKYQIKCQKESRQLQRLRSPNIIYRKDKRNINKQRMDTSSRLTTFCSQKNISLM